MIEIPVTSRADWLALRRGNVGASEVAALFGVQPAYAMSHWTLWQVKSGRMPEPEVEGDRPDAGLRFERAAAEWIAEGEGWTIGPIGYVQHPTVRGMGCSPDFRIIGDGPAGDGLLEVKWADWLIHKRQWGDEPPQHVLLQLQAQLACTGMSWGAVGCIVGGNERRVYRYDRRPAIIAEIERRVAEFWRSIDEGREPEVDGSDSTARALATLYPDDDGEEEPADLSGDNELPDLCVQLRTASDLRRQYERAEQQAKNGILAKLGEHRAAYCQGFRISAPAVKGTPDRVITEADVGTVIKGRAGHRRLSVKELTA